MVCISPKRVYNLQIMSLVVAEAQELFPHEDISESNAELLELCLLHQPTIEAGHSIAEDLSLFYKYGHQVLETASRFSITNHSEIATLSYGIAIYETIAAFVRPTADTRLHNDIAIKHPLRLTYTNIKTDFRSEANYCYVRFSKALPRTQEVVGTIATRFCLADPRFAMLGAAFAFELESNITPEQI